MNPQTPPNTRRRHLVALAGYVVLTLFTLGPLHPTREVWGGPTDDFFEHVQLVWWQAHQAASGHPFPLFTTDLAYPDGGSLFLPDPIGGTFAVPLVWVGGVALGYNLLMLVDLVFACWAMFWLVRRRTGDDLAAGLAGALYGLSPVLLGNLHNGITEIMQGAWLPLFAGLLLELLDMARQPNEPRRAARAIVATGLAFALVAIGQWYYGIYACLLFGLLVPARARLNWRAWAYAAGALAAFAVFVAPVAWVFARSFRGGGSLFYLGNMDFYLTQPKLLLIHSADPAYLLAARPHFDHYLHLGYVGFVVPALLVVGLLRRRWTLLAWVGAAAFFIVLSWGPILGWRGELVTDAAGQVRHLPYFLLYKVVPFFKEMRLPYRFFLAVHLCLALAVGVGLAGWLPKRRWRAVVFAALLAAAWAETALLSGAPVPAQRQDITVPAAIAALADNPTPGAVVDLPIHFGPGARGRYLVGQTAHHRPLVFGIQGRDFSPTLRGNLAINVLFMAGREHLALDPGYDLFRGYQYTSATEINACLPRADCPSWAQRNLRQALGELRAAKIFLFVLHRDLLGPDSTLPAICRTLLGEPFFADDQLEIFRLAPDA